jgi:hypothetical protein
MSGTTAAAGWIVALGRAQARYLDRNVVPLIPTPAVVGPPIDEVPDPARRKPVPVMPALGDATVLDASGPAGRGPVPKPPAFCGSITVAPMAFVAVRLVPTAAPAAVVPVMPVTPLRGSSNAPIALRATLRNTSDGG